MGGGRVHSTEDSLYTADIVGAEATSRGRCWSTTGHHHSRRTTHQGTGTGKQGAAADECSLRTAGAFLPKRSSTRSIHNVTNKLHFPSLSRGRSEQAAPRTFSPVVQADLNLRVLPTGFLLLVASLFIGNKASVALEN